jgi:hypothetical protein
MKRILLFMLSCFVVSAQTLFAEEAEETYWIYTEEGKDHNSIGYGYITNGVWKLYAKRNSKNSSNLYVDVTNGEFKGEATKVYPINLTDIYNNSEKSQRFFVTSFGYFSSNSPNKYFQEHKDRLSEFIAPDCTLISGVAGSSGYNFYQCTSLTNVVLNEDLKDLPTSAFAGCSELVNFYPRSFKKCNKIVGSAFSGCKKLAGKFSFDACTTVSGSVFNGCELIEEVSMPAAVGISSYMFNACKSLKKVDMPSATSIGESAFGGCEELSELTVSPNLEQIASAAFKNSTGLPPDFFNRIAGRQLKYFGSKDFKTMGSEFLGCTSLTSLIWNFPNLETNVVNSSCFSGCSSLGKVVFKTPVDEIQASAFMNIREGAEIYLPKEVPGAVGQWAIGIKKADKSNPVAWPKAFVPDETKDQWLEKMGQTCCYFKKEQFNVNDATAYGKNHVDYAHISLAHALEIMKRDTDMCTYDSEKLILKDNRVVGFVFAQKSKGSSAEYYGCWVLRAPESGFQVIVR